jgi:FAD/FMN-containing dehydrogenase
MTNANSLDPTTVGRIGHPSALIPPELNGTFLTSREEIAEAVGLNYNQRLASQPWGIARCTGVADVKSALAFAQMSGLPVAVRCGGHGVPGWATVAGGIVIDLSLMRWARVDPHEGTAWVGGGTLAGDLAAEAAVFGFAAVTGLVRTIGLGGLALSCGEGYLSSSHGFAADQILEAQLVTPDGEVLTASADRNPDLFWGLRGAGANFGVVTALKFKLHPMRPEVLGGALRFAIDDAVPVLEHFWDRCRGADPGFWPSVEITAELDGTPLLRVITAHVGRPEDAKAELEGFRGCGRVIEDGARTMSYLQLLSNSLGTDEEKLGEDTPGRTSWDMVCFPFDGDPRAQVQALIGSLDAAGRPTAADMLAGWRTLDVLPGSTRGAVPCYPGVSMMAGSFWLDPAADEAGVRWVRESMGSIRGSGQAGEASSAPNHIDGADEHRVRAFFGAESYERLARLKARYDPQNVLSSNFNVAPVVRQGA